MKKVLVVAVALAVVVGVVGSASAANSLQAGKYAISVGMGDSVFSHSAAPLSDSMVNNVVNIYGRYLAAKDMAIYGGFGIQVDSGDADGTYLSLTAGIRKYLKVSDFATFVAGQISFTSVDADVPAAELDIIDFAALFGAEYFLGKEFSLEGAIGLGFGQASFGNTDDVYFGTRTVGIHANFYF